MKSIKYLLIIAFLSLSLVATLYLVGRTTIFQKRASSSSSYVLENSYLFASPLQAKASDKDLPADRREMIRLTVFLLDGRGLGVANQTITLHLPKDVTILSQQEITDNTGKAVFDIASSTNQTFYATASVGNNKLPQKVRVIFY